MRSKRQRVTCASCSRVISARTDGSGPVAHKCPHGKQCVYPAWTTARPPLPFCMQCDAAADPGSNPIRSAPSSPELPAARATFVSASIEGDADEVKRTLDAAIDLFHGGRS